MRTGMIFDIQRFSVQDGPGIRTTVFFKGCPLDCAWCHNPESKVRAPQLSFDMDKCVVCGACAVCARGAHRFEQGAHTLDRTRCIACGACVPHCPAGALEVVGRTVSVDEVMDAVLRDRVFYAQSGGGLTLSGGEPLLQPAFAAALARRAKEAGLHVCVETCGCCRRDDLLAVAANTDLFLFDYKLPPALYPQYTGARAEGILENLGALSQAGASAILRCPILPGLNDNDAHCDGIAAVARRERCVERVELMPYHPLGLGKAQRMDMPLAYQKPDFLRGDALADFAARIEAAADKPVRVN